MYSENVFLKNKGKNVTFQTSKAWDSPSALDLNYANGSSSDA